jgi:hypothetical protein
MLTNRSKRSHTRGNTVVPYRWQVTPYLRTQEVKSAHVAGRDRFAVLSLTAYWIGFIEETGTGFPMIAKGV